MAAIDAHGPDAVVFINSNLTPHLRPRPGVRYIYDLFAPKVLELEASAGLSSPETERAVAELTAVKVRALAMADAVWVNGARKLGYARGWLDRSDVRAARSELGRRPDASVPISVVDMAVPLPVDVSSALSAAADASPGFTRRLGIAGYAQKWSALESVHPGHQQLVDAGHELHALLPGHWGGSPSTTPTSALPEPTITHDGPLLFEQFAAWVQSMDAMVDVFAPSPERRFAMITRSAVALRLGVPLIHAVDSEIADIVVAHNAGWVLDPDDTDAWDQVVADLSDAEVVAEKTQGASEASRMRFAPHAALQAAHDDLVAFTPTGTAVTSVGKLPRSLDVLVPFWGLAGGVIKVLDYAEHAAELGLATTLWAPPLPHDPSDLVMTLPVFQRLMLRPNVVVRPLDELELTNSPTILFTEPTHHPLIERAYAEPLRERLIHLVQGTRHANPAWNDGLNYRLLHRPMTRIAVSDEVGAAIAPLVNGRYPLHTIVEGHDATYFASRPTATTNSTDLPLRVMYTTWKSDLGDRVAEALADDDGFAFIAVRTPLGWPTLRNRYHGADVLLCTPGPEEGFYLPGLEAMAAGTAVVTALAGGNEAYIRAGENALAAPYDDVTAHVDALRQLRSDPELTKRLVAGGAATIAKHTIERERNQFADVLRAIGT